MANLTHFNNQEMLQLRLQLVNEVNSNSSIKRRDAMLAINALGLNKSNQKRKLTYTLH